VLRWGSLGAGNADLFLGATSSPLQSVPLSRESPLATVIAWSSGEEWALKRYLTTDVFEEAKKPNLQLA